MHGFQGRYGELLNVRVSGEALAQALGREGRIRLRLCCEEPVGQGGGLTVYGSRAGRYPCDVHLIIAINPPS
jgi:predicted transcriptional regulator